MIILGIILVTLIMYFVTGIITARFMRSAIITKSTILKGEGHYFIREGRIHLGDVKPHPTGEINRDRVRTRTCAMVLGWPVYLPMFAINHSLDQAMDKVDPLVAARQAARIAELEKELLEEST